MALKSWGFTIDTEAEDLERLRRERVNLEENDFFIEPIE